MNRYEVNKALWDIYRDKNACDEFTTSPDAFFEERDLTAHEQDLIVRRDLGELLAGGAHPFLLYNFALRLAGGWSFQFLLDYVEQLKGQAIGDVKT